MIFIYFQDMDNDFLHKIDLKALSAETGLSLEEIAKIAGINDPKNLSKWKQGKPDGSRPKYNAIVRLLKNGATTKTLFGVDCNNGGPKPPDTPELRAGQQPRKPIDHNDPEWQKLVKNALAEMKQNGQL